MSEVPIGLPLEWHDDGTPIFLRGDFIRNARPLPPKNNESAVIYDELMLPEHRSLRSELRFNLIVVTSNENNDLINQVWLGKSSKDPKSGNVYGRVIQALDSTSRVILQRSSSSGKVDDFIVLTMQPLQFAVIPPLYETILVNISDHEPARFVELQSRNENRDIENLLELDGPGYKMKGDGKLEANKNYDELPIPKIQPGLQTFKFLKRRPLYYIYTRYPNWFDFIDPPRREFYAGAL